MNSKLQMSKVLAMQKIICRRLRENREKRKSKFYDKPHPYPVGLAVMSNKYMEELGAEGKSSKTQNKVKER